MAANVARQNDENLGTYYDGKHYKSVVNATAAKLLRIIYWMLNSRTYLQNKLKSLKNISTTFKLISAIQHK